MTTVNFKDSNRNLVVAKGFEGDENAATLAIDSFLEEIGEDYGRDTDGDYEEETDTFYFRVTDYSN